MHEAYIASNCSQNMATEEAPLPDKNIAEFERVHRTCKTFS